jgi:hypothetical protein
MLEMARYLCSMDEHDNKESGAPADQDWVYSNFYLLNSVRYAASTVLALRIYP